MKSIYQIILFATLASVALSGCNDTGKAGTEHVEGEEGQHEEETSNMVELSEEQIAATGIAIDTFSQVSISDYVSTNGILDLPPNNIASLNAPMAGFVKSINYLEGAYVKQGAAVAELAHPDYIQVQQNFLEQLSRLTFLEKDLQRQQQLSEANVNSQKRLQEVQADFSATQARVNALEQQLEYLGLSVEKVKAGDISQSIYIRAPFSGTVTALNAHRGQFVKPEEPIMEMINIEHMHLELNVFEKDLNKVGKGQQIIFTVPAVDASKRYKGEVYLVGKDFDMENKTIKVHGHLEKHYPELIRGLYVEAKIFAGDKAVKALPEEAILSEGGLSYIFIQTEEEAHAEEGKSGEGESEEEHHDGGQENGHAEEVHGVTFRRVQVNTGIKESGYVEVIPIDAMPENASIVVKGAYYLTAEMKKGEGGAHAH